MTILGLIGVHLWLTIESSVTLEITPTPASLKLSTGF
jgi:hypothetical protein